MRTAVRVTSGAIAMSMAVLLGGCGSDSTEPTPTSSSPAASPSASTSASNEATESPEAKTIEVAVSGSTVTPAPARIKVGRGQPVHLVVTLEEPSEVHVHGADVTIDGVVGPNSADFTAPDQPGLYEVELHHPSLLLFQLQVQ